MKLTNINKESLDKWSDDINTSVNKCVYIPLDHLKELLLCVDALILAFNHLKTNAEDMSRYLETNSIPTFSEVYQCHQISSKTKDSLDNFFTKLNIDELGEV